VEEEWRVSLLDCRLPARWKPGSADRVRDLLRDRLGGEVPVTARRAGVFLYAATAEAAAAAEAAAREVLSQQGLFADVRVERWDPSGGRWLAAGDPGASELPPGPEPGPGRRRLRSAGAWITVILEVISDSFTNGGV
jgi:hypothetical protein